MKKGIQKEKYSVDELKEGMILPFDKPLGWTSFSLVNRIRYSLCKHAGIKKLKVGHAGTLDPLATGLLILCTGKSTKKIASIQEMPKEYIADITFGGTTPSYDLETEIENNSSIEHLSRELVEKKMQDFIGSINQVPPLFSAKMVDGVRAYTLARDGIQKKLDPKTIEIYEFEILDLNLPVLKARIKCSKGTYIRSLAHDLGQSLKCGAYLSGLKRTAIGEYVLKDAYEVEKFKLSLNLM